MKVLYIYLGGRQRYSRDRRSRLGGFRPSLSHPSKRSSLRSSPSYYSPSRRLPLPDTARWIPSTISSAQRPTKMRSGVCFTNPYLHWKPYFMSHFDEKPYFSCVVFEGGIFLAQHTNPVLKALGMWRRVCAHARKSRTAEASGVEEASRGCLIHAANAIEFYRERRTTSYSVLHFSSYVRSSGSFVLSWNHVTLQSTAYIPLTNVMQVLVTHAVKVRNNLLKLNTSLSSVGYPQELIILIFKLYEWYISS